jgi:hypothetical protein
MNLLLKYGGPWVSVVVGFCCVCAAVGGLFSPKHLTTRSWLGLILVALLGIACLASAGKGLRGR